MTSQKRNLRRKKRVLYFSTVREENLSFTLLGSGLGGLQIKPTIDRLAREKTHFYSHAYLRVLRIVWLNEVLKIWGYIPS